jgi:hypothetical protein
VNVHARNGRKSDARKDRIDSEASAKYDGSRRLCIWSATMNVLPAYILRLIDKAEIRPRSIFLHIRLGPIPNGAGLLPPTTLGCNPAEFFCQFVVLPS